MKPHDVNDTELSDFITSALARRTRRGRGYWRRAIGGVVIGAEPDAESNWSLRTTGSAENAAQIDAVVRAVRQDFPFVVNH